MDVPGLLSADGSHPNTTHQTPVAEHGTQQVGRTVIIITGQGRSGTSLVAQVYRELGFDPGGEWMPEYNAGFEDHDIVRANGAILGAINASVYSDALTARRLIREDANRGKSPLHRLAGGARNSLEMLASNVLGRPDDALNLIPWERFDELVREHGPRLVELAATHPVVKDPRFCWTLGYWAAAGARIDHVLVCVRNVDAMVRSRNEAKQIMFHTPGGAKNSFIYALGLLMSWIYDHRLEHAVVQFPDFLQDPARLHEQMRFPQPVTREAFLDAWSRVVRPEMVHDRR